MELPIPGADVEALASTLRALDDRIAELRIERADVEARLYDAMSAKTMDLPPPLGRIERGRTTNESWESPLLFKLLVHCAVDPDDTGEVPPAAEVLERVQEMVTKCVPMTASLGWRKTGLRSYLSDEVLDQYVTRTGGRKTVHFSAK